MYRIIVIILLCLSHILYSEEIDKTVKKEFIIVYSTTKYKEALNKCNEVNKKLNYNINFRGLEYNKEIGLSYSKEILEDKENGGEEEIFPWYFPRGRNDDGEYISIEYSNGYKEFKKGYYIIIIASGDEGTLSAKLEKVKKYYKDAYIKRAKIYMGCME